MPEVTISLSPSQRQKLVLVLGMHRSGTSCLTGLLEDIGFSAGKVDRWDPFNHKGNREDERVNRLNNALLQTANFAWNAPPPLTWDVEQAVSPDFMQQRDVLLTSPDPLDPSPRILKDPRILLTLPFWCETSADLRFIGIFRHPWAVACSVAARDTGQSLEDGLALWLAYNERLLQAHRRQPFPLLCFDLPPEDFVQQLRHALQTHFADWIETEGLHLEKLGTFYSEALVHQAASQLGDASMLSERGLELLERVRSLYQTLCHLVQVAPLTVESLPADPARQLAFWLPQADALHKAGQAEAELALCQQALAQVQPQDRAPLWRRVLRLRRTLGNAEALLSDLLRISQECPQDPDLLLKGAEWLEQQGEHSGALQILNIAVGRAPQWFLLRLRLGQYLMRSQQPEQACAHLEHARLLGPDNSAAHMALMNCYAKLGQRTAAIDSYHAAAQIHNPPHQAMIEHQWAVILTQWGEREKALEHRQRAVDSPYVLPHMVVAFAQELLALGQRERALQVLSSAQAAGMESPQLSQLLNRCQA
jgi:tetratricopeptide (TPR) repeat protein